MGRTCVLVAVASLLLLSAAVNAQPVGGSLADQTKRLKQQSKLEEALAVAQKAVEANDSDAGAHYVLAWLLVDEGRRDGATAHFQKALSLGLSGKDAKLAVGALRRLGAAIPAKPTEGQGPPAPAYSGTEDVQQPPPAPAAPPQAVPPTSTNSPFPSPRPDVGPVPSAPRTLLGYNLKMAMESLKLVPIWAQIAIVSFGVVVGWLL